jgi:general secretion pathway protein H
MIRDCTQEQGRALGGPRFLRGGWPFPAPVGFTLIEILVVIVIVGVIALAVTLSIATSGGERQLAREAERLQALVNHACDQAELSGREIGIHVAADGFSFSLLGFTGWQAHQGTDELRPRHWEPGIAADLLRDGQPIRLNDAEDDAPQIVCFSSGEMSPFLQRLELGEVPYRYELRGEDDGQVDLRRVARGP